MTEFTRKRGVMRTLKTVVAILLTSLFAVTCDDPKNGPAGPSPNPPVGPPSSPA
jgi:hypothetical protein